MFKKIHLLISNACLTYNNKHSQMLAGANVPHTLITPLNLSTDVVHFRQSGSVGLIKLASTLEKCFREYIFHDRNKTVLTAKPAQKKPKKHYLQMTTYKSYSRIKLVESGIPFPFTCIQAEH